MPKPVHAEPGGVSISLLGAMYRPDLDSESLTSGEKIFPFYRCFYRRKANDKEGPINPLMGAEFDWHIFDSFGSLELGVGLSYTMARGHALKQDNDGNFDCNSRLDNVRTSLHILQLRPQLTYLFNYFDDVVPFIPYIRGALIANGYSFFLGSKNEPKTVIGNKTIHPNGFRFGYQAAVGLMFRLDFLEPNALASARSQGYFEHVYLKAELSYTKIDSFGRPGLQFSSKDVMGTSLPLMWTFGLTFDLPR